MLFGPVVHTTRLPKVSVEFALQPGDCHWIGLYSGGGDHRYLSCGGCYHRGGGGVGAGMSCL